MRSGTRKLIDGALCAADASNLEALREGFTLVGSSLLFLSVLSRTADPNELEELNAVIAERYYDRPEKKMEQAMIVLDYLSRLSELYYTPSFN